MPIHYAQIGKLLKTLDTFSEVLDPVAVTVLAARRGSEWFCLSAFMRAGLIQQGSDETIETGEKVVLIRRYITVGAAKEILRRFEETRELVLDGRTIKNELSSLRVRVSAGPFWAYSVKIDGDWPKAFLEAAGTSIRNIISDDEFNSIDDELRTRANPPFDGLADLSESYLGYSIGLGHSATFYAMLVLPIDVKGLELFPTGQLRLSIIRDPQIDPKKVELAVIAKGAIASRHKYKLDNVQNPRDEGTFQIHDVDLKLQATNPQSAIVYLIYDGEILKSSAVISSKLNPRLAVHRIVDPTDFLLRESLNPMQWTKGQEKKRQLDFEEAVATLLHLSGFLVDRTGRLEKISVGKSLADLLAFTPDGDRVLVVSCVGRSPEPDDITKLAARGAEVASRLLQTGTTVDRALFTAAPENEIPQSLSQNR